MNTLTSLWIMFTDKAISNLLHGLTLTGEQGGQNRIVNIPGLTVTVADMLEELQKNNRYYYPPIAVDQT